MANPQFSTHPSRISVTDPISPALAWTRRVLFEPFDVRKWFVLGFCAWLARLGERGVSGGNWNVPGDDVRNQLDDVVSWVQDHLTLVIVLAAVGGLLVLGLWVVFTWLGSRGKLMFLDGVVHDRGAVVEPWVRFRDQGNSLFVFRLVLGLAFFFVFGSLAALLLLALATTGLEGLGAGAIAVLAVWIPLLLSLVFVAVLVSVAVNDVVVPLMWLRGCRALEAWSECTSLLGRHPGGFALYVLMKILIAIVTLVIGCVAVCATCCIALLPYIGTVILLPLSVFHRSYSIFFLSQLGPDYAALAPRAALAAPEPEPPAAPAAAPPPPALD